jgi:hypothetical protein
MPASRAAPPGQPRHLHAHDLERGRHHAGLDAADEAPVLRRHPDRVVHLHAALGDDVGHGGETGLADVEERHDLGMAVRDDVPREGGERRRARAAGVDDGRDARVDAAEVGIDAGPVDALEHVGVQVDQPRRHDLAPDLDHPRRLRRRDDRRDARDRSLLDGDVHHALEPARRVHHRSALQHEIVHASLPAVPPARFVFTPRRPQAPSRRPRYASRIRACWRRAAGGPSATTRPSSSTYARWAISSARTTFCSTSRMATPSP